MKKILSVLLSVGVLLSLVLFLRHKDQQECPTSETFSQDFNKWSVEFLAKNPGYAETEQRAGWKQHLKDMNCSESKTDLDDAICADCELN